MSKSLNQFRYHQNSRGFHSASMLRVILASLCLTMSLGAIATENHQSTQSLRAIVGQFIKTTMGSTSPQKIVFGKLDPRLKLAKCTQRPQAFLPVGGRQIGYTTIGVRCDGNQPWKVYVPVNILVTGQVLVTTRPLPRGTFITASDVMPAPRELSRITSGYFMNKSDLIGMELKRSLKRGKVITPTTVKPARLVKRGENVTILAESGNLSIRVKGKALMDGRQGQTIRVTNLRSKRELQATVVARGIVKINM